jgi:hypothetical protein
MRHLTAAFLILISMSSMAFASHRNSSNDEANTIIDLSDPSITAEVQKLAQNTTSPIKPECLTYTINSCSPPVSMKCYNPDPTLDNVHCQITNCTPCPINTPE